MNPLPSHRYIRLRAIEGVSLEKITRECVEILRLPGVDDLRCPERIMERIPNYQKDVGEPGKSRVVQAVLRVVDEDFEPTKVDHKALKKKGRSSRRGKLKAEPIFWVDDPSDPSTLDEYILRYRLDPYLGTAGRRRLRTAIRLWQHSMAKEIVSSSLLCGKKPADIVPLLKKVCPDLFKTVRREPVRPIDITSFQELFLDFSGMGHSEVVRFLSRHPGCSFMETAASQGLNAMLFRMGLGAIEMQRVEMIKKVQTIAFLEIDRSRMAPQVDALGFQRLYSVLTDTFIQEDKYLAEGEEALVDSEFDSYLEAYDAEEIPGYSSILENVTQASDLDSLSRAEDLGLLTAGHAETLRKQIMTGEPLSEADLSVLLEAKNHYRVDEREVVDAMESMDPLEALTDFEPADEAGAVAPDSEDFYAFVDREEGAG